MVTELWPFVVLSVQAYLAKPQDRDKPSAIHRPWENVQRQPCTWQNK